MFQVRGIFTSLFDAISSFIVNTKNDKGRRQKEHAFSLLECWNSRQDRKTIDITRLHVGIRGLKYLLIIVN